MHQSNLKKKNIFKFFPPQCRYKMLGKLGNKTTTAGRKVQHLQYNEGQWHSSSFIFMQIQSFQNQVWGIISGSIWKCGGCLPHHTFWLTVKAKFPTTIPSQKWVARLWANFIPRYSGRTLHWNTCFVALFRSTVTRVLCVAGAPAAWDSAKQLYVNLA